MFSKLRYYTEHPRYCCLLANPQNLDLSALLNVPPMESPFAKAMQAASHVLVIPNHSVGIYTRHLDKNHVETSDDRVIAEQLKSLNKQP